MVNSDNHFANIRAVFIHIKRFYYSEGVAVSVLQRNRTSRQHIYMYVYKEIYFKELAFAIVEASKFKICKTGLQAGNIRS